MKECFKIQEGAMLVVANICALSVLYQPTLESFASWKERFAMHKIGSEADRFAAWKINLAQVMEHNVRADAGQESYRLGMTSLADLTNGEYRGLFLQKKGRTGPRVSFAQQPQHRHEQ